MNWYSLAAHLWYPNLEKAIILAVIFIVPLFRLISYPVAIQNRFFRKLNKYFGLWEEIISPLRNSIGILFLIGCAIWNALIYVDINSPIFPTTSVICLLLIVITCLNSMWKRTAYINLADFVEQFPNIHPQEFFDHLLSSAGIVRNGLPKVPRKYMELTDIDFSKKAKGGRVKLGKLLIGLWSSIKLSRLAFLVNKRFGKDVLAEVAPSLATIWATRILQLIEGKLDMGGLENLPEKRSRIIFLFTHKSFLDFVIAPIIPIIMSMRFDSKRRIPLFLLAMDHFKKNIILYRVIGIGKVAEALGMIFVNRSDAGNRSRAQSVIEMASEKLMDEDIDLAIFPQGTRVYPYPPQTDEPYDAGYYTVGSKYRLASDGGHLKKGASYIATDVAISSAASGESKPLEIIPIAIGGTARACPRGKMGIRSGVSMKLTVGDPILLTISSVKEIANRSDPKFENDRMEFSAKLHNRIDSSLKNVSKIHSELERRFFKDIHDMLDPLQMDEVAVAMKTWRGDDYLVHAILDCIYTCPRKKWRQLLGELAHNILNFTDRDGMLSFKGKVASNIPGIK